jgi:hypothetical protein
MKERPILFSAPMVRAILEPRKTQTRRVVKFPEWVGDQNKAAYHLNREPFVASFKDGRAWRKFGCPYGQPGDRLWVRETFAYADTLALGYPLEDPCYVAYRADKAVRFQTHGDESLQVSDTAAWNWDSLKWRPSIHMPRWASRINLEVTGVRVERLQDINDADAVAEGISPAGGFMATSGHWQNYGADGPSFDSPFESYRSLWESINGAESWKANPWVWVVEFRRVTEPAQRPSPQEKVGQP